MNVFFRGISCLKALLWFVVLGSRYKQEEPFFLIFLCRLDCKDFPLRVLAEFPSFHDSAILKNLLFWTRRKSSLEVWVCYNVTEHFEKFCQRRFSLGRRLSLVGCWNMAFYWSCVFGFTFIYFLPVTACLLEDVASFLLSPRIWLKMLSLKRQKQCAVYIKSFLLVIKERLKASNMACCILRIKLKHNLHKGAGYFS